METRTVPWRGLYRLGSGGNSESGLAQRRALPARCWVILVALLPVLDPIVNQLNTAVPLQAGPFSALQLLRGALLVMLLLFALSSGGRGARGPTGWISLFAAGCLAVIGVNEFYLSGELPLTSIVAEVQILYWALAWHVAATVIRGRASAALLASGLVAGALVTAISVLYGYASDAPSFYRTQGVDASSGWFISAKGIAGTLTAGGLLAGYLAWQRRKPALWVAAAVCICALLLTYARAGIVAACCALVWLLIWTGASGLGRQSVWARRMLLTSAIAGALFFQQAGTESLVRRWSDLQQPGYAGSGRLILWRAACERFLDGSAADQMLGIGYAGMLDVTQRATGLRLHTHSDPLDLLLIGGMAGLILGVVILAGIIWQIGRVPFRSPEFAVAVATLIVMLVQGCLTGQIFLPDVMTYYLLVMTAVLALGMDAIRRRRMLQRMVPCAGSGGGGD